MVNMLYGFYLYGMAKEIYKDYRYVRCIGHGVKKNASVVNENDECFL